MRKANEDKDAISIRIRSLESSIETASQLNRELLAAQFKDISNQMKGIRNDIEKLINENKLTREDHKTIIVELTSLKARVEKESKLISNIESNTAKASTQPKSYGGKYAFLEIGKLRIYKPVRILRAIVLSLISIVFVLLILIVLIDVVVRETGIDIFNTIERTHEMIVD